MPPKEISQIFDNDTIPLLVYAESSVTDVYESCKRIICFQTIFSPFYSVGMTPIDFCRDYYPNKMGRWVQSLNTPLASDVGSSHPYNRLAIPTSSAARVVRGRSSIMTHLRGSGSLAKSMAMAKDSGMGLQKGETAFTSTTTSNRSSSFSTERTRRAWLTSAFVKTRLRVWSEAIT